MRKYHGATLVKIIRTFYSIHQSCTIAEVMNDATGETYSVRISELSDTCETSFQLVKEEKPEVMTEELFDLKQVEEIKEVIAFKTAAPKKIELIGSIGSGKFNKFLTKNSLIEEVVISILEGKQKSHKGYSFKFA